MTEHEYPNPIACSALRDELKLDVATMRDLGVTRWRDIELGPVPGIATSEKDEAQRIADAKAAEEVRKQHLTFGASGGPRPRAVR